MYIAYIDVCAMYIECMSTYTYILVYFQCMRRIRCMRYHTVVCLCILVVCNVYVIYTPHTCAYMAHTCISIAFSHTLLIHSSYTPIRLTYKVCDHGDLNTSHTRSILTLAYAAYTQNTSVCHRAGWTCSIRVAYVSHTPIIRRMQRTVSAYAQVHLHTSCIRRIRTYVLSSLRLYVPCAPSRRASFSSSSLEST